AQSLRGRATGEAQGLRREHPDGPPRPAQRGRAELPLPRLRGQPLHVRPGAASQWRDHRRELTSRWRQARKGGNLARMKGLPGLLAGIVVAALTMMVVGYIGNALFPLHVSTDPNDRQALIEGLRAAPAGAQ